MNNNLAIIVGAGSNLGELEHFRKNTLQCPTNNFLSLTSKETNHYPFLDYILKNAEPLNTKSNDLFSMTDGWLLLDLLGKFYLGKKKGSVSVFVKEVVRFISRNFRQILLFGTQFFWWVQPYFSYWIPVSGLA